jgi:hypothetical protein
MPNLKANVLVFYYKKGLILKILKKEKEKIIINTQNRFVSIKIATLGYNAQLSALFGNIIKKIVDPL